MCTARLVYYNLLGDKECQSSKARGGSAIINSIGNNLIFYTLYIPKDRARLFLTGPLSNTCN